MSLTSNFPRYSYVIGSRLDFTLDTLQDLISFCDTMLHIDPGRLRVLHLSDRLCDNLACRDNQPWLGLWSSRLSLANNLQELRLGNSNELLQEESSIFTMITKCRNLKTLKLYEGGNETIAMFPEMLSQLTTIVHSTDRKYSSGGGYDYGRFFQCTATQALETLVLDSLECHDDTFVPNRCFTSLKKLSISHSTVSVASLVAAFPLLENVTLEEVTCYAAFSGGWLSLQRLDIDVICLQKFAITSRVTHLVIMRSAVAEHSQGYKKTKPISQVIQNTQPVKLTLSATFSMREPDQYFWNKLLDSLSSVRTLELCFEAVLANNYRGMEHWMVSRNLHSSFYVLLTPRQKFILPRLLEQSQVDTLEIKVETWARILEPSTPAINAPPHVDGNVFTGFRNYCHGLNEQLAMTIPLYRHTTLQWISVQVSEGECLNDGLITSAFVQRWQVVWFPDGRRDLRSVSQQG